MARQFVDLSIYLENDVLSDPPGYAPQIKYLNHEHTYEQIKPFFPGLEKKDLPDGEGWAIEMIQLTTHNGTHLDAPYHFHSTMDKALGDKRAATTIDDVPLEWCFQPGVKLDFRHFADGYVVTAQDVEDELKRIKHELQPLEIVVINTAAGMKYGHANYVATGTEANPWTCEKCGGSVVQRADDTPEAINHRLDLYDAMTSPLVAYYKDQNKLAVVDGLGTPDEVFTRLSTAVAGIKNR
jgi:kynurenine formamidase